MKHIKVITVIVLLCSLVLVASKQKLEFLFNKEVKKSVEDVYTDPNLAFYERYTYVWELCYKGDIKDAHQNLIYLKDQGVILSDQEIDQYTDSWIKNGILNVKTYSSKSLDDGNDPYSIEEIEECKF